MSKDRDDVIHGILEKVSPSRRGFMKQVLLGAGVAAVLAEPASYVHAEQTGQTDPNGKGNEEGKSKGSKGADKGKGKDKGKSTGKGEGKGEGKE